MSREITADTCGYRVSLLAVAVRKQRNDLRAPAASAI